MAAYEINDTVDITDVNCPITFVKAKVALDELEEGEVLKVHMNGGEPANIAEKLQGRGARGSRPD